MSSSYISDDRKLTGINFGLLKGTEETYLAVFPFTADGLKSLRPGCLLACENLDKSEGRVCYSVLEAVKVIPVHYAIGPNADRLENEYIGFATEAASQVGRELGQDEPSEETARIRMEAIPTDLMLAPKQTGMSVLSDDSYPRPGGQIYLVSNNGTEAVINKAVNPTRAISPACLTANSSVRVSLDIRELVRTHFGVFGFTKSGKSNLVATLLDGLLRASAGSSQGQTRSMKVVVLDYMSEYFTLLADIFREPQGVESSLLLLEPESNDSSQILQLLQQRTTSAASNPSFQQAAEILLTRMVIPDELEDLRPRLLETLTGVLSSGGLKVYSGPRVNLDVADELRSVASEYPPEWLGLARDVILAWNDAIENSPQEITIDDMRVLARVFGGWAVDGRIRRVRAIEEALAPDWNTRVGEEAFPGRSASNAAKECLRRMSQTLTALVRKYELLGRLPRSIVVSESDMMTMLNRNPSVQLVLALGERADRMQRFFSRVANQIYEERRRQAQSNFPVFFAVDEADEFLTQEERETNTSLLRSRRTAELIARRGRKLNLGIGIATQRVSYIDTRVLGQIHTYFVSKLPRKSDRDRVAEAYGMSEEKVAKTLSLRPGEWMAISHSALGVSGVPIMTRFDDSAERVRRVFQGPLQSSR